MSGHIRLSFHHHEEFHRECAYMVAMGAVAGLIVAWTSTLALAGLGMAMIVGAATIAGAITAVGGVDRMRAGLPSPRRWVAVGLACLVFSMAGWALKQVALADGLVCVPRWLSGAFAGGTFGFISILAQLPRHIRIAIDRVGARYARLEPDVTGELRELSLRSVALWRQADSLLAVSDPTRDVFYDAVMQLLDCVQTWLGLESEEPAQIKRLAKQMAALEDRIGETSDSITQQQYERANTALAAQLGYAKDMSRRRERVIARMHSYVAAMEQLHMAALNLESKYASEAVQLLVKDVELLADDIGAEKADTTTS